MEETKKESGFKQKPLWKKILIIIVGILCALAVISGVISVFMFFTLGQKPDLFQLAISFLALLILIKIGAVKFSKNKEIELEKQSLPSNENQDFKTEKRKEKTSHKFLISVIIFGIIAVSVSLIYYFVIRPIQKDTKLKNCLKEAEQVQGYDNTGWGEKRIKKSEIAKDYCFKLY